MTEDKRFGYVTYQDIRSIESFRQKTVLVVKAPPETELQVPQDHIDGDVSIIMDVFYYDVVLNVLLFNLSLPFMAVKMLGFSTMEVVSVSKL